MRLIRSAIAAAFVLALAPQVLPQQAIAQQIGTAAVVRNQVTHGQNDPLEVGEGVIRNEFVTTGANSSAKLVFKDDTNLSIGPQARIKLDRFVFSGESTYSRAAVEMAVGAFRFSSGNSEKKAYQINTPVAVIGVRGTIIDVRASRTSTTATLVEGQASICERGASRPRCIELTMAGQSGTITLNGTRKTFDASATPTFSFASLCASDPLLCSRASSIAAAGGDMLCGR